MSSDGNTSLEEKVLAALRPLKTGVASNLANYLKENKVPYYSQLAVALRKKGMAIYNKDLANPWSHWIGTAPPDIQVARSLLAEIKTQANKKTQTRKDEKKNNIVEKMKVLCDRLAETSPGFGMDFSDIYSFNVDYLNYVYQELEKVVKRSEIEGPVYEKRLGGVSALMDMVINASDPSKPIPWDGVTSSKFKKSPNVNYSKNSLTFQLLSMIRAIQIMASVDPKVDSRIILEMIYSKMGEDEGLRKVYLTFLKKEL